MIGGSLPVRVIAWAMLRAAPLGPAQLGRHGHQLVVIEVDGLSLGGRSHELPRQRCVVGPHIVRGIPEPCPAPVGLEVQLAHGFARDHVVGLSGGGSHDRCPIEVGEDGFLDDGIERRRLVDAGTALAVPCTTGSPCGDCMRRGP